MRRKKMHSGTAEKAALKDQREHQLWGIDLRLMSVVLLILLLSGCGYSFSGMSKSAYPAIQTVFVDTFTNRTSEANLDIIVRAAFSNEIVQNGHFKLASSRGEADAIFRGTILSLQIAPLAYKAGSLSAEDRITVTLELFFEERVSGRALWSNGSFIGTGDYRVTAVGATEINRKNSLTKLAGDAAEKAYRLMMSDF
jgi:hypothetical protein